MSSTSQSVNRAIELFRLFAEQKRALSAIEIANMIKAPRSSCSALLKTLSDLNMISIDRRTSSYLPTAEFAELGAWLSSRALYPDELLTCLDAVAEATNETVTLSAYQDLWLELVHVNRSRQAISFAAERGQRFPVWGSAVGTAYLSGLDTPKIRSLYRRAEDKRLIDPRMHHLDEILHKVEAACELGYAAVEGGVFPDAAAVAVRTGYENNGRALIAAIAGPTSRMKNRYEAYGRLLIESIRKSRSVKSQ